MKTFSVSCEKNSANKNPSVRRIKQNTLTLATNCAICSEKNQGSIKIKK